MTINTVTDITQQIPRYRGARHIIPLVIDELSTILLSGGYINYNNENLMNMAPEIDTPFYNFTVLNIPENHPTRDDHQTFFTSNNKLLRSQTSNAQARILQTYKQYFKTFTIGRTYRNDNDATHTPMFHQLEILTCTPSSSITELYNIIKWFLGEFFYQGKKEVDVRFRPSHFPFTAPSFEVDMFYNGNWLELMGCGITHQQVFKSINMPFRYCMALGAGVERLAMIKYNITDIREFYDENVYNKHKHYNMYKEVA